MPLVQHETDRPIDGHVYYVHDGPDLRPVMYSARHRKYMPVAWTAQPGSQDAFLECDHFEVLYEGTRGPGKTDALLMDFAQHVGAGFGSDWNGILFRRTYPELGDVIAKSQKWFSQIFGKGARYNASDHSWRFHDGETLKFRHMKKPDDYWSYHGHAYCVEERTPVLMDDGQWKQIKDICAGDYVETLNGPRRVSLVYPRQLRECVRVSCPGQPGTSQVQSEDHRLLANVEEPQEEWSSWSQNFGMSSSFRGQWLTGRQLLFACQESLACFAGDALHTGPGNFSATWTARSQAFRLRHSGMMSGRVPTQPALVSDVSCLGLPRTGQSPAGFFESSLGRLPEHCPPRPWDRRQTSTPEQLLRGQPALSGAASCVQLDQETQSGSQAGYYPGRGLRDEPLRTPSENDPAGSLRPGGAAARSRLHLLRDAVGISDECSRQDLLLFAHPYLPELRRSDKDTVLAAAVVESCGSHWTVDIAVEDGAQYITEGGFINQNCWQGWEELCTWPNDQCYKRMFSCARTTNPKVPIRIRSTANPYGVGHNWVKKRWNLPVLANRLYGEVQRFKLPGADSEIARVAIHGELAENKLLLHADPSYVSRLRESARNEQELRAWLYGDWNIVAGGMFDDVWSPSHHILPDFDLTRIPKTWRIDRSYDHGQSKPFSVGWWAESNGEPIEVEGQWIGKVQGDLIRISEWYGWDGKRDNEGLRLTSPEIARGIVEHEKEMGIHSRVKAGAADSSIFDNYEGNKSVAGDMRRFGVRWEPIDKGPGSRKQGWEQMRKMLRAAIPIEGIREEPGLFILENCKQFQRTVPVLPRSDRDLDDVDTEAEDHVGDEVRYRLRVKRRVSKIFRWK